jgi:serine/threonine-protein kinase
MTAESGTFVAPNIRLSHRLGEGGMGEVWVADHLTLERQVAVKVIRGLADGETSRARFEREAKAAARIQNPHVVQVFDYGVTESGAPYITMELLTGENLAERIARGPMSPQELAPILVQTANALATAHDAGVVHRDIKPPNIFLVQTPSGEPFVKVLDFGIAMLQSDTGGVVAHATTEEAPPSGDRGGALTQTGAIVGTPEYMSPEQLLTTGEEVTHTTDIWSLGVVAYEALVGARPFAGQTVVALCMSICDAQYDRDRVPPPLRPWFDRVFAVSPTERFASVMEAAEAFREIATDGTQNTAVGPSARQQGAATGVSRGVLVTLALGACAVGAVVVVLMSTSEQEEERKAGRDLASVAGDAGSEGPNTDEDDKPEAQPASTPPLSAEPVSEPSAAPSVAPDPVTPSPTAPPSTPLPWVSGACKKSCADVGACGKSGDSCIVRSDADCRRSDLCRNFGRCTNVGGTCTATSASDCAASSRCKVYGQCGLSGNACVPTTTAHCRQSTRCGSDGKCVVSGPYCIPGSDADCKAAEVCARAGSCYKNGMVCTRIER